MQLKYIKWIVFIGILIVLLGLAIMISLTTGEMKISFIQIFDVLTNKEGLEYTVIQKIRFPRILLGISVGGALSLSGAVLQGIYRNPLVEPYTLGISGGAALGVALAIVLNIQSVAGAIVLPLFGFSGSIIAIFLVYFLGIRRNIVNINNMLLIGVMISFIASSAMMFLMSTATTEDLHSIVFWIMGSLDESSMFLIKTTFYTSIAGLLITYLFARPLNALRLGEIKAKHLGINSTFTIQILFIVTSILTGISVSVAGVIGFVGLVVPHIIRAIIGPDFRILLLGSFLGGSIFIVFCDILSRVLILPNELPIGVITGMAGGLIFIMVLSKSDLKLKMK